MQKLLRTLKASPDDFGDEITDVVLRLDGSDDYYYENRDTLAIAFWLGVDLEKETT